MSLILLGQRLFLALQQLVEYPVDDQAGTGLRPDRKFFGPGRTVLHVYDHFCASGARKAMVLNSVDSASLIGGQCPGTLEISLDQPLHNFFCAQKVVSRNRRSRCLDWCGMPRAHNDQHLGAQRRDAKVRLHSWSAGYPQFRPRTCSILKTMGFWPQVINARNRYDATFDCSATTVIWKRRGSLRKYKDASER